MEENMGLQPFVFACGDESPAVISQIVVDDIFGQCPRVDVPLNVPHRVETNDACIAEFAKQLSMFGAGAKMSTATDHPDIKRLGLSSANIKLRKMAGVVGMIRMTHHPLNYDKPVIVLRYASGDYYNETGVELVEENGVEFMDVTTRTNLSDLTPFAEMGIKLAREHGFRLRASSKYTVSESERIFMDHITDVFHEHGLVEWTKDAPGDYRKILTDLGLARIANEMDGGWCWLLGNANGDTGSDIAEIRDGSRSMGSTLFCRDGAFYEELPGGTAPDFLGCENWVKPDGTPFNPTGIILSIAAAVERANPDHAQWIDSIRAATATYITKTAPSDIRALEMIKYCFT